METPTFKKTDERPPIHQPVSPTNVLGPWIGTETKKHEFEAAAPISIPCPFCERVDELEIITWNNERPDGTEYQGDAVRCNRCDAIAPAGKWAMRNPQTDSVKGDVL